jgi:hypothetical protein
MSDPPHIGPVAGLARARWLKPALWGLLLGALVALRLLLPFRASDTQMVHDAIVDSLLAGHNWGRQALVGALEYPLLPTLGLLALRVVCGPGAAAMVLVALSQGLAACYLLRLRGELPRRAVFGVLLVLLVFFLPDVRAAVTALDPNWLAAVPFCAAVLHLVRWFRAAVLRDAVLCAVNAGLLAFCGLGGILAGLALTAILARDVRPTAANRRTGLSALVWAPLLYCLALWFLWSWLILGDLLFCLKHLWGALAAVAAGGFLKAAALGFWSTPAVLWAGMLFAASGLTRGQRRIARGTLVLGAVVAAARVICLAAGVLPGAAGLLAVTAGVVALALLPGPATVETVGDRRSRRLSLMAAAAGTVALVAGVTVMPHADPAAEAQFATGAPSPTEITRIIDRDWPQSRTAVFGVRLPALYHDPAEKRFVARMDYHEALFVEQARREVMHLLLPPPDGRFYPRSRNAFSRIYGGGSRVLLLEKQWASGWQLWRCVIFPDDETRLKHLQ